MHLYRMCVPVPHMYRMHAPTCTAEESDDLYPFLLVNIGSGVSMVKVTGPGPGQYERVSGSSIGGGTFWGLCQLLTQSTNFDEMLDLSMQGDNANVGSGGGGGGGGGQACALHAAGGPVAVVAAH